MSGELVAPQPQLKEVGYTRLPRAAHNWGELTKYVADLPDLGPVGGSVVQLAQAAYRVFAETADRLQDSAEAVCKIYHHYELTDKLNADQMPEDAGIAPLGTAVTPRTDLG